mgnify:CR=1 FL=1
MSKFKEMFYYGNFKKRIIITIAEYILASIIWILVDQSITYSLFDGAIAKENIGLIIFLSIVMFAKVVSQIIEGIIQCKLRHHLQRDFSNYARKNIFNKIIKSKINFFDKSNSSELFELIMNDSDNLAKFFSQNGNQLVGFTIRALTYIIILLFINVKLTLILILIYFIGYASLIISNRKTIFLLKEIRNLNVSITKWITEQINGFENIKALKIEKNRLKKMETLIEKYSKECCRLDKIIRKYVFVYNFFSLLTTLVVVYIGGLDILSGVFTYGSLMIFVNATSDIKKFFDVAINYVDKMNESYVSFLNVLSFNDNFIEEKDNGKLRLNKINNIKIENLNFSYTEDKKILKNINLQARENEKLAIIGRTGSGKSTLVNLLCRFYDLEDGEILINGVDYRKYKMKDLRNQIGYVLQDVVIFDGNVYENINYANKNISNNDIKNICKRLNLHSKIMSLENGYETNLNKNRDLLSQGEKQMINFARILVENPSVVILDEVTSSLSYENEQLIKNAINEIIKGRICFIVAHRLSTIKNCNNILLMKDGKIIEKGNHTQLMNAKGEYYKLVNN